MTTTSAVRLAPEDPDAVRARESLRELPRIESHVKGAWYGGVENGDVAPNRSARRNYLRTGRL